MYSGSASRVQPAGAFVSVSLYTIERSALRPENVAVPALFTVRRPLFSTELVQPPASMVSPVLVNTGCHDAPLSVEYSKRYSAPVRIFPSVLFLRDGYTAVTLRLDGRVVHRDCDGLTVLGNIQGINGVPKHTPEELHTPDTYRCLS